MSTWKYDIRWDSKFAYEDKLHDQPWFDTIIDIYTYEGSVFVEFSASCVRVPAGWNPPRNIVVGDVCLATYDHRNQFRFEVRY